MSRRSGRSPEGSGALVTSLLMRSQATRQAAFTVASVSFVIASGAVALASSRGWPWLETAAFVIWTASWSVRAAVVNSYASKVLERPPGIFKSDRLLASVLLQQGMTRTQAACIAAVLRVAVIAGYALLAMSMPIG